MAVNKGNTAQKTADESWKSDAFFNINLPRANGTEMKFAVGFLKESDEDQLKVIEWLRKDPEKNSKILLSKLTGTFREAANPNKGAGFDFMAETSEEDLPF